MFHDEFFPTPKAVIRKMIEPYTSKQSQWVGGINGREEEVVLLNEMTILEPSAGKGDILEYINEKYSGGYRSYDKSNIYCIEQSAELVAILQDKGYRVISTDFLEYHGDYHFDLIIMNPPFSNGDEHLLKAWNIMHNGNICCLLNAETIRNPHTEQRKHLVDLIEKHGTVEYIGQAFSMAERATNVEVAIVRLKKTTASKFDFDFDSVTSEKKMTIDENTMGNPVALRDTIGNMILQYDKLKQVYVEFMKFEDALRFYASGLLTDHTSILDIVKRVFENNKTNQTRFNGFADEVKQEIWKMIIDKVNLQQYMTSAVRSKWNEYIKAQGAMDFTKENVDAMVDMIFSNRYTILDQAIVDVFNLVTSHNEENRYMVEGWKTNAKWKVNRKIILPYAVKYGEYMSANSIRDYGDNFKLCYTRKEVYRDIDRVMCYLSGKKMEHVVTIEDAMEKRFKAIGKIKPGEPFDSNCESEFFDVKFFKKGTMHIVFKDERLWKEFNMRACAGKKWLPEKEEKEWKESKVKQDVTPESMQLQEPIYNKVGDEKLMEIIEDVADEVFGDTKGQLVMF